MKSLKSWLCLLLLFALSLLGMRDSQAKVILTISKPAPKPALVVTYRIIEQDAAHLRVDLSVTNRQKTWYYVNTKNAPHFYGWARNFFLGPLQTYTFSDVSFASSRSGSLAADSTLTKYKEVPWVLGIDAMYRVGMGTSLPVDLENALRGLIYTLHWGASSDSDRTQLLSALKAYTAALKRKDVEGCAQVMKSMIYNPLLTRELYDEDEATALKFKSTIEKFTTTKLLTLARSVAKSQIDALSAPQTDVVTYSTKFVGSAPKLVVSNLRTNEGDFGWHWMMMDVRLSAGWWQPVSVDFSTSDGTAKVDEDYTGAEGTVTFSPGQTIRRIQVRISGDTDASPDETFKVSFSKPSKNLTIPKDTITVTIADDDKIDTTPSNKGKIAYNVGGDIYVMNLDATNKTRLTDDGNSYAPAFSPDGSKIAFGSGGNIYVMNADGTDKIPLTDDGGSYSPAFSPDGSKIAFVSVGNIYVMNADGTNQKQLTDESGNDSAPAFSPDGSKIAFSTRKYGKADSYSDFIYVMNVDGTNPTFLNGGNSPEFSRDGKKIASGDVYNIDIMNADGTGRKQLTDFIWEWNDSTDSPTFSPDGSKIAFSRYFMTFDPDFAMPQNIYVINANATNLTFLVEGFNPSWAPGSVPAPVPPTTPPASPSRSTFPSGGAS